MGPCTYKCPIIDCLEGLEQAIKWGWYTFESFDVIQYQHFEKVENGDLNWIIPGKFIAFSGPQNVSDKYESLTAIDYVPIFHTLKVQTVIRLNKPQYDKK